MNLSDEQQAFVESDAARSVFMGGRVSGKTTALMKKANRYAKEYGADNCLIIAPNHGMADEIRNYTPRRDCDVIKMAKNANAEIVNNSHTIQAADHIFIEEYTYIDKEHRKFISQSGATSISAVMTPINSSPWIRDELNQLQGWETIVAPSYTNPSPRYCISVDGNTELLDVTRVNGHAVMPSKNVLRCVKCSESFEASNGSAIEKLNTYGKFHTVECENWSETFK